MDFFFISNNSAPIFSLFNSIILIAGLFGIGDLIAKNEAIKSAVSNISNIQYQKILISVNLLILILTPLVYLKLANSKIIIFISLSIFFFGIREIVLNIKKFIPFTGGDFRNKYNFNDISLVLISFFLLLVALSPVTHADSLDYHLSVSKYLYQNGSFPVSLNNYHNLLAGSGEIIISLGFFFKADQFGSLIQFSGLISIFGIFKNFNKSKFYFLLIVSSPVILFLVSSPKPQLFAIASNFLVVAFILKENFKKFISKNNILSIIILCQVLLINSVNTKFSFILSSGLLSFSLCLFCIKNLFFKNFLFVSSLMCVVFYFPTIYWKHSTWGGPFFNYFFEMLPLHIDGMENFKNYIINYKRGSLINFFIPNGIGQITDTLGLGLFYIVYKIFFLKKHFLFFYVIIFIYVIIGYFFGQPTGRFFIEPLMWLSLYISIFSNKIFSKKTTATTTANFILFFPIKIQFAFMILITGYGAISLFPGSLSLKSKDSVLIKNANGYALFQWANEIIQDDSPVISMHRSVSLGKNKTLATNFLYYVDNINNYKNLKKYHLDSFVNLNPKYLLTFGNKDNVSIFKNCIDHLYSYKKNAGLAAARNPFNRGNYYDGYIYKLKDIKVSGCLDNFVKN